MEPLGLAIDFGSTRTKVAYFNSSKNEARLIELGEEDRNIIPSVFYIPKEGNPSVGDDALMMVDHDPEGIVIGLKREIHRSVMVRCGPGRPPIGRVQLASEIFSYIRRKCQKEVFFEKNINLDICTLTVPVSFVEQQRDCIRKAAELAGFKHIMLIEEPVAAARAWLSTAGKTLATDHVIICDAGGGTTDFGLLRYEKGRFESVPDVPTEGFPSGGNDIDESILDRVLEAGTYDADSAINSRGAFLVKIRKAKELFARHPASEKPISLNGITLQVPLKTVKDSGQVYIEKTVKELRSFLSRCNTVGKVHEIPILLVGGGSRLSGLKEAIEVLAPGRVFQWNQSNYATVLGAATPLLKPVVPTTPPKTPNPNGYREVVNLFKDNPNFTNKNLEDLTRMSIKLRLSKEEASQIETEVLGMPKELFYDLSQEQKLKEKENLSRYREVVAARNFLGIKNFTIIDLKHLTGMSTELRLSNEQASQIETEVLGMLKEQYYDLSLQKQKENLSRYREVVAARNFLGIKNFTIIDLKHLTGMSTELRLSKEQASQIETEVLGMPKEHLDFIQEKNLKEKENLSRYREEVKVKAFLGNHNFTIKDLNNLTRMSNELGLSEGQASQIETEVLGMPKKIFYDSRQKGTKNGQAGLGWSKPVQFPKPKGEPPTIPKVEIQPQGTTVQKAGEIITNELGMKFAWIPPGTFMMGSPESEADRSGWETSHKVTITKGFYLGIYTVTQEQWEALTGGNPTSFKFTGAKLPVTNVSWERCQSFINYLNTMMMNGVYRLPTEAEWEYACRAGTTTAYSFGDVITPEDANYQSSFLGSVFTLFLLDSPKAVGSYKPNAFGLYDMHGNVSEWCEDWLGGYPSGPVLDPKGPETGPETSEFRVSRGGSYFHFASQIRSSNRSDLSTPTDGHDFIGLRLAWTK